jgi:Zn-dependent protease
MATVVTILVVIVGWIFSLCLHEFSHALVAYYGGDTSVREKGYLTFNPLKYTHPIYSILLPMLFLFLGGIGLPGGAVYIETWRLRSKRWESAVSLAGPAANLVLAVILSVVLRLAPIPAGGIWPGLAFLAFLQVMAAVLNLIPVPPFDGYGVFAPYLDRALRARINQAGSLIMLAVFFLLWYVPLVGDFVFMIVRWVSNQMGIPLPLASLGSSQFLFWRH